jgi:hypothetical protein
MDQFRQVVIAVVAVAAAASGCGQTKSVADSAVDIATDGPCVNNGACLIGTRWDPVACRCLPIPGDAAVDVDVQPSDGEVDMTSDTDVATDAVVCCPIETPSCGCFGLGGAPGQYGCSKICDATPNSWMSSVDEHGCPAWVPKGGVASCLSFDARDTSSDPVGDRSAADVIDGN